MNTSETSASRLRRLLREPGIIVAPGAYDCLTARIIEQAGFPAVYMTGAGTSVAALGYPDLGLATMTEMVANASGIADTVDVPVIADADTGYGGILNVQRTVHQYERAGVAAIHIEDQDIPKRCGHLDDHLIISIGDMVQNVRPAVDARNGPSFVIISGTQPWAGFGGGPPIRRSAARGCPGKGCTGYTATLTAAATCCVSA